MHRGSVLWATEARFQHRSLEGLWQAPLPVCKHAVRKEGKDGIEWEAGWPLNSLHVAIMAAAG